MKRQTPKYSSLYEYIKSEEKGKELFDLKEQFDEELWCQHIEKLCTGEEISRRRHKSYFDRTLGEMHSIVNHGSAVANFLAYKGLPELCDFDCDGTIRDDYCKQKYYSWFMREIYRTLWHWQDYCRVNEDEFMNRPIKRFAKSCYGDESMGPDTMNSFWRTLSAYLVSYFDDTYKWDSNYKNTFMFNSQIGKGGDQRERAIRLMHDIESLKENRIKNDNIITFAQLTHTTGNMVLVPEGYNGYRGKKDYLKDYYDLSLDNLVHSWDGNKYLGKKDEDRQRNFKKYINTFFLWDYVDESYNILPLCVSHRKKLSMGEKCKIAFVLPEKSEIDYLCIEINNRIKRRCLFMNAMLKIALGMNHNGKSQYEYHGDYQEKWKEWNVSGIYKKFMEEIFLKVEVYTGYGDVIDRMKAVNEGTNENSEKEWINGIMNDLDDLYRRLPRRF